METAVLRLCDGSWFVNGFGIAGNPDDGYTVWREDEGMDSDTLYESRSFEKCVVWCMNS